MICKNCLYISFKSYHTLPLWINVVVQSENLLIFLMGTMNVDKKGDVNKKFEQIKHLWMEAEWVINGIEYEKKEVERKIKKGGNKKRIISLESELRRKEEEIETLWNFREELEELMAAACEHGSLWACEPVSLGAWEPIKPTILWAYSL